MVNTRKLIERLTIFGVGITGAVATITGSGIEVSKRIMDLLMWPGLNIGGMKVTILSLAGIGALYVFAIYIKKNMAGR
jgi:hypothetical protein